MRTDLAVGNTLPDMAITFVIAAVFGFARKKK